MGPQGRGNHRRFSSGAPRRLLPDRLLLPPEPVEPAQRERWRRLSFLDRRRLAAGLTDDRPVAGEHASLMRALAARRLETGWRLYLVAAVLGWLVLMTVWGFGRSTYPAVEQRYLAAGLFLGLVAGARAAWSARLRLRRIRDRWGP